jgi:Zn-dependent peptidase ImmA (M78 family)
MPKTIVDAYKEAAELLSRLKITTAPTPVEKIAKELGAQIRFAPFDEEISGMIHVKNGTIVIGVNALHHPNRQRFTIAHELGHLVLHKDKITSHVHIDKGFPAALMRDTRSASGTDTVEVQANQFASELLVPQALLDKELAGKAAFDMEDEKPLEELAKKFRVSKQAIQYKILSRA